MTPRKLTLKGFKGVRSGLGRDAVTLDFDQLAGDAHQVALVGPNGKGKSTILDNMHPYRTMPSRSSKYSPDTFSYWDHVHGPEALKEFVWEHRGDVYRSTLVFKSNGKTRRAEAYLHVQCEGAWQPVRIADGTVSDGKTESYDRVVEAILGTPETFFTSVFAAQSRKPLSSYTEGEIKTLLADLLGLERLREIGAKALQVTKLLGAGLEALRFTLAKLTATEEQAAALRVRLTELEQRTAGAAQARATAQQALAGAQQELATVKAAKAAAASVEARRLELTERLSAASKAANERLSEIASDVRRETERFAAAGEERRKLDDEARRRTAALRDLAGKRRTVLARKTEIESAAGEVIRLEASERDLGAKLKGLRELDSELRRLNTQQSGIAATLRAVEAEQKAHTALCEGLRKRAGLVEAVPCQGTELQPNCPLLKEALDAKASLAPELKRGEGLSQQHADSAKRHADLQKRIGAMGDLSKVIAETEEALRRANQELRNRQQIAALAPQLADAEDTIQAMERQVKDLEAEIAARDAAGAKREAEYQAIRTSARQRELAVAEELRRVETQVKSALAELPAAFDETRLAAAQAALERAEKDLAALDQQSEQTRTETAEVRAKIQAAQAELAQSADAKRKLAGIEAEIALWTLLAKAFSTNGIIALAIDDAGPALTGIVNDLLLACYGRRFTVSIKTQVATAKGELREGFDLLVHDAERDETKRLEDMSAGERVWINDALGRGIALHLAREAQSGYDTLFSDEADGPLDAERKVHFMRLKREVLRLGGYRREYFVSQTPELWAMADARIDLEAL